VRVVAELAHEHIGEPPAPHRELAAAVDAAFGTVDVAEPNDHLSNLGVEPAELKVNASNRVLSQYV
jgi:hypothetical protein